MITKQDDLLGTLIHDVAHLLRLDIDRRLEPHNLTRVKWLALGILKRNGPSTQAELAVKMELGNATVGRLLDRLEDRGFIERSQDPNDRRSNKITLTNSAVALLKELDSTASEFRDDALGSLSETDVASLNKGLIKIKKNLKATLAAVSAVIVLSAEKVSTGAELMGSYGSLI